MLTRTLPVIALAALLFGCATTDSAPAQTNPEDVQPIDAESVVLMVRGMGCPLCSTNLRNILLDVDGVEGVEPDLNTGDVRVKLVPGQQPTRSDLRQAVMASGFTLAGFRSS